MPARNLFCILPRASSHESCGVSIGNCGNLHFTVDLGGTTTTFTDLYYSGGFGGSLQSIEHSTKQCDNFFSGGHSRVKTVPMVIVPD